MNSSKSSNKLKIIARLVAVIIILAALICIFYYYSVTRPLSEDAMLQADVVHISTPVPGRVEQFHIEENSRVKRGDLLFSLDPTVYRLRVAQAEAELKSAQAIRHAKQRQINAELSNVTIANEQIKRALTNLELTKKTLDRLIPLSEKGYVTKQQIDDARTLYLDAQVSLSQAQAQEQAAENLVSTMEAADALVDVSQSNLALAKRALSDTKVYAPHNGLIVGLSVSSGEYVAPDQSLFTLINTEEWYATAFFRETDLTDIQHNACASVYVLADPSVKILGAIDSIGWGISSTDMIELPRTLPIVQKSLNWVRVAQRFPVRIRLKDAPENLLRVGASAVVVVDKHDNEC